MFTTLVSVALAAALGQAQSPQVQNPQAQNSNDSQQSQMRKIDGQWEVVSIEMDGKKAADKAFGAVTIRDNQITCSNDGKEKSWKLTFGPHHRIKADETTATAQQIKENKHVSHGVYIASQDFLCFSMNHGRGAEGATSGSSTGTGTTPNQATPNQATPNQATPATGSRDESPQGTHFVMILRRAGASGAATTR